MELWQLTSKTPDQDPVIDIHIMCLAQPVLTENWIHRSLS